MAIDTAEKRRAVVGARFHFPLGLGITPNSGKDAEWRQQAARAYSGIPAGAPVAATGNTGWLVNFIRRRQGI